jgi:glutamate-1-semialdehyde 2,1-aminomutase
MSKTNISSALYEQALRVIPGGVSRNSVMRKPHPIYASHGEGCYVTDVEGVQRIDFANNMSSLIHGHGRPEVVAAVTEQLHKGTVFTMATEVEMRFAEHLCGRSANFEKVRFVNSGTEAVMSCIKAARAYTGRQKIAKIEGAYHGTYDYAEVSQTAKPGTWGEVNAPTSVPVAYGTPSSVLEDVIVLPFNDVERALAILDQYSGQVAGILIDLMPHHVGLLSAAPDFVRALHQWGRDNGALLIVDEVITFRNHYGGAQEAYQEACDVAPDLTALGKIIGGGFPVGAIAGRADVLDVTNPLSNTFLFPQSGTFSANNITMTAGLVSMQLLDKCALEKLNRLGEYAREQLREAIRIADVSACVSGQGSMFRIHFTSHLPNNYREVYARSLSDLGDRSEAASN